MPRDVGRTCHEQPRPNDAHHMLQGASVTIYLVLNCTPPAARLPLTPHCPSHAPLLPGTESSLLLPSSLATTWAPPSPCIMVPTKTLHAPAFWLHLHPAQPSFLALTRLPCLRTGPPLPMVAVTPIPHDCSDPSLRPAPPSRRS